jgi:hypothetical protein
MFLGWRKKLGKSLSLPGIDETGGPGLCWRVSRHTLRTILYLILNKVSPLYRVLTRWLSREKI